MQIIINKRYKSVLYSFLFICAILFGLYIAFDDLKYYIDKKIASAEILEKNEYERNTNIRYHFKLRYSDEYLHSIVVKNLYDIPPDIGKKISVHDQVDIAYAKTKIIYLANHGSPTLSIVCFDFFLVLVTTGFYILYRRSSYYERFRKRKT